VRDRRSTPSTDLLPYDSLESLVFHDKISCRWMQGSFPNEKRKKGHP